MSLTLEEALASLRVLALPMRTTFRSLNIRETALFKGENGWGEFAPFVEYSDQESLPWLESAIEAADKPLSPALRESIPINATVPASNDEAEIEQILSWYPGVDTVKIKVGTGIQEDLVRIAEVRKHLPKAKIRIDVNGSWSVKEAALNVNAIYEVTGDLLEYVEQPVTSLDELKQLKEGMSVDVKIAGDEVLRKAKDPFVISLDGAIDILMLKVSPLGGIKRAMDLASHHKLPVVISSALESAVGISYGLALAARVPNLDYACGLGTSALFKQDVSDIPIVNGAIKATGYPIDLDRVERYELKGERLEWWRNRISRVWNLRRPA
ncbi:MAG TPA: o-succinylbenzoate synthase [Candidatus Nanopelagicaceae bacterium]|nr:o-succinylbenzoate synthase [Candidatus Nanopelagicaceae bacterium]